MNYFRQGFLYPGLLCMGMEEDFNNQVENVEVVPYEDDPVAFKRSMLTVVKVLQKEGF